MLGTIQAILLAGACFAAPPVAERVDATTTLVGPYIWHDTNSDIGIAHGDVGVVVFVSLDLQDKTLADSTTAYVEYMGAGSDAWRIVSAFEVSGMAELPPMLFDFDGDDGDPKSWVGDGEPGRRRIHWINLKPDRYVIRLLLHGGKSKVPPKQVIEESKKQLRMWAYTRESQ